MKNFTSPFCIKMKCKILTFYDKCLNCSNCNSWLAISSRCFSVNPFSLVLIQKLLHNLRRITVILIHMSCKSRHFSALLSNAVWAHEPFGYGRVNISCFITPDHYRPPLTTTVHRCVNQSGKKFFHHSLTTSVITPSEERPTFNTELENNHVRVLQREGGRRHHMSSCRADITFYPISNLWNNTGSGMSEPLTSPATAP